MEFMPEARASAVLVNLYQGLSGVEVVLTKRASHLKNHKGEISFPGGRVEPDEQVHEAALREAVEEVALPAHDVTLVGELDHLLTVVSNSYIIPIVGMMPYKPTLVASADEVDRVLHVPLRELVRADTYASEVWETPMGSRDIYMYHLDDETIWGATARVLTQLLHISLSD
jgi:8-oxo-dGTP pyrophosphatase MutT (NUDIX family)